MRVSQGAVLMMSSDGMDNNSRFEKATQCIPVLYQVSLNTRAQSMTTWGMVTAGVVLSSSYILGLP